MNSFVLFVFFLSTFVLLTYAQNTTTGSCEDDFNLPTGQQCTPCQQTLHKYNFIYNSSSTVSPPDNCFINPLDTSASLSLL